jgi:hypothetical protein
MQNKKIKAEYILVTNDREYQANPIFLREDHPEEWAEVIEEFCDLINEVKFRLGNAHYHVFLTAPLPIAFGIGAMWGTTTEATVYHWEPKAKTYYPVVQTSRLYHQGKRGSTTG